MFAGTGTIAVNAAAEGAVTKVGVALIFGLVHMNPAVSLGFYLSRRIGGRRIIAFVAAQSAAAIVRALGVVG